jgi:DNA-binding response OmpR family regulator
MELTNPIRLLFIDDDCYMAVAQQILSRYQGRKFEILWKKDGNSGIAELESNPGIDLLLLDYYLPSKNGLEVAKKIRELKLATPIIFLTSNRDFRLAIEVMKYGVEDYIIKDEAIDSVLPRSILNILERVELKRKIAEQLKADLIAQRRTEAIKELVVTICHEFNNPLAAIKISTDIIMRQTFPPDQKLLVDTLDKNIEVVEREITKLRDINFDRKET